MVNNELINILKDRTPQGKNAVDLLMDIIPISKEAAYRRLRGDIPFSLEDAISICKKLNISLDLLAGTGQEGTYAFHLDAVFSENPIREYSNMLLGVVNSVRYMGQDPECLSLTAEKMLPGKFILKYDSLSKIYIYVLLYQLFSHSVPNEFSGLNIPDSIFPLHKEIADVMHTVNSVSVIDKRVVIDFIEIVKYFHLLGVISKKEIDQIKQDMHLMLNDLEQCASTGRSFHGKKMDLYICNVSFDCTYTYIEGAGYKAGSVGVYCINHISSMNPGICDTHKRWINSLIRFSYLISASGELQRNRFFQEQRTHIDSMF